ncbi:MAG: hypothetical protein IJO60_00820 [Agathobacter sp.]|nr:hypothetical protein [Agathobacter sp.]
MKRYKRLLFVCIAACSLVLGGCGDALHELTVEEEALIVHYAAYAVAKHNIQQKDGMSGVYIPEAEPENTEGVDAPEDTQSPEDTQNPDGQGGTGDAPEVDNTTITLAEAIGHGSDLVITYAGSVVADDYVEGSAYAVDASEGKNFYIMKFLLTNTTQADVEVENVTKGLKFKLVSGGISVDSQSTFLMTDLSTYYGTIPAGKFVETVLLFEVPENDAEQITEPVLQILVDDVFKNVKL